MVNRNFMAPALCMVLLLVSCTAGQETAENQSGGDETISENDSGGVQEDSTDPGVGKSPDAFFPAEGTVFHFRGEGNEFAQLKVTVLRSDKDYAILQEDNGGITLHKMYRIGENEIDLLYMEPAAESGRLPADAELDGMEPLETSYSFPPEEGTEIGRFVVTDTSVSVDTPYRTFSHAVLAEENTSDYTNRVWFVPGYGEVKRESVMDMEEGVPFTVSSALETVESP